MKIWLVLALLVLTSVGANAQISVLDKGAKCDSSTDDTTAFQAAIDAAAALNENVTVPAATGGALNSCVISSTLNIGNGSSTSGSTTNGPTIIGLGTPGPDMGGAYNWTPMIKWSGGASPVFSINGPGLQAWGLQNLYIWCQSTSGTTGVKVVSGAFGNNQNLYIRDCATGILSTTVSSIPSGLTFADSIHNSWYNLYVKVPNISGATGIKLTSANSTVAADTDYNTFVNTMVWMPYNVTGDGIIFQNADDNAFFNLHIPTVSGNNPIVYDYSLSSGWPAGNSITHMDAGSGVSFSNVSSNSATANYISDLSQTNGASIPFVANLIVDHGAGTWTPILEDGGGAHTATLSTHDGQFMVNGSNVTLTFQIQSSALNSMSGAVYIAGFPIAAGGIAASTTGSCTIQDRSGITDPTGYNSTAGVIGAGNAYTGLVENGMSQSTTPLTASALSAATTLEGVCTYTR